MNSLGIENITLFITTGILLNLYPGPDTLYIVGRSLSQGRKAGVAAALGIGSGSVVHTVLGAFGLSAILATSAHAFTILKLAGCCYLLYQGVLLLRTNDSHNRSLPELYHHRDLVRIYQQGALTNILNPKVAVFFLALLPQFISASSPSKPVSFLVLGGIFITTGTIWCLVIAVFSSSLSSRLSRCTRVAQRLRRVSGIIFVLLGLKLATARLH